MNIQTTLYYTHQMLKINKDRNDNVASNKKIIKDNFISKTKLVQNIFSPTAISKLHKKYTKYKQMKYYIFEIFQYNTYTII